MNILNFRFELSNMLDRWEFFKPLGSLGGRLFWHKAWELEHSYMSTMLIDLDISITACRDHAGLNITVGLLGYGVHFSLYDTRHWDYKQNAYAQNNS